MGDAGEDLQGQMAALRMGGGTVGRIDLHEGNIRAGPFQFQQAAGVLLDFLERGFLVVLAIIGSTRA